MPAHYELLQGDPHDRELLNNVHPPDWVNPTPAPVYNLVVIGGGTAGLVSAAGAALLGAKVALVERGLTGGDCLVTGCVPSKALLRAARAAHDVRDAARGGPDVASYAPARARGRRAPPGWSHRRRTPAPPGSAPGRTV